MIGPKDTGAEGAGASAGSNAPRGRQPSGPPTYPAIILAPPRVPTRPRRNRPLVWSLSIAGATIAALVAGRVSRSRTAGRVAVSLPAAATPSNSTRRASDPATIRAVVESRDGRVVRIEKRPYSGPRPEGDTTASRAPSGERTVSWRRGDFLYTLRGEMSVDSLLRLGGRALP